MHAVVFKGAGGPEVVTIADVPRPEPGPSELLVRVHASALNRGDLLQRDGEYHVPEGQSAIPGVEIAGVVESCGPHASGFRQGDRVFGVVEGGGFAEYCRLDAGMANPVPGAWGFAAAAATAESWLTADETLFTLGGLAAGESVLVHASASGVGTAAVQQAVLAGAVVYGTAGLPSKVDAVRALGAAEVVNHRTHDFVDELLRLTGGRGVDLVLDFLGGKGLGRNLSVLRHGGCLVAAGLLDGVVDAHMNQLDVIERRLQIKGSSLRLRPMAEKRMVNARFRQRWLDRLLCDEIRPVIHAEYRIEEINSALQEMEENHNIGKIVLWIRHAG
ncbi:MAG TPA: NAD(P)H-quinone oxidoreductase [Candidatus Limnocylindrales bacterium]|nr:NAD(P)H-quinone oxidoreductase [Candidatus Limnocylindrales bacterium]